MSELGPCFRAPRHAPESCPHDEAWRFSWTTDDVRPDGTVQTLLIIVCMACDTLLQEGPWGKPAKPTRRRRRS